MTTLNSNSSFKRVFQFYFFTCFISFSSALPLILYICKLWPWQEISNSTIKLLNLLYTYGPFLGVLMIFLLAENSANFQDWKNRLVKWKVPIKWYALSIFIPFFSVSLIILTYLLFSPENIALPKSSHLSTALSSSVYFVFAGGPVGEEPGWRGYAQPLMEKKLGVLKASIFVGILWFIWHIPAYILTRFQLWGGILGLLLFGVMVIICSIIIGFITFKTQSTIIAIIFHASFNTSFGLTDLFLKNINPFFILTSLIFIFLLILLVFLLSSKELRKLKLKPEC